jgi:hypothetical protein
MARSLVRIRKEIVWDDHFCLKWREMVLTNRTKQKPKGGKWI